MEVLTALVASRFQDAKIRQTLSFDDPDTHTNFTMTSGGPLMIFIWCVFMMLRAIPTTVEIEHGVISIM